MPNIKPMDVLLNPSPGPAAGTRPAAAPPLASTVKLAPDSLSSSGTRPNAELGQSQAKVAADLGASAPPLSPAEVRRLLNGPQTLSKVQHLLQREPRLAQAFAGPAGEKALKLIQTASLRRLNETEVKQLQRYLVEQKQAHIVYKGHPTGIDGDYGRLSHAALVKVLAQAAEGLAPATEPASEPAVPAVTPEPPQSTQAVIDTIQTPELLRQLQLPGQSLQQIAGLIGRLPADELQKLATLGSPDRNLKSLLAAAAKGGSRSDRLALQSLLVQAGESLRYPGHATGIDGNFGQRSAQALARVTARLLTGEALKVASPMPQYARMHSDQLVDMTMAIGFDEGTVHYAAAHTAEEKRLVSELETRGFVRDDARARDLLKAAGKETQAEYAALYVKENVDQINGKPIHAIVRLVQAGDGTRGAANRKAAIEGMNQSDVFAYGGHGRYGNGPDFDRNFTVTVNWEGVADAPEQGTVVYKDYEHLKQKLGGSDAQAISRLKALEASGKLTIQTFNDGNIRMSEQPLHSGEFGAQLTTRAVQGLPNSLGSEISSKDYKLWLFEACRTSDFVRPIRQQARGNEALNARNLDLLATEQVMYWQNTGNSMLALLDGVLAKESTDQLLERMKTANPEQAITGRTHSFHGLEDNPRQ